MTVCFLQTQTAEQIRPDGSLGAMLCQSMCVCVRVLLHGLGQKQLGLPEWPEFFCSFSTSFSNCVLTNAAGEHLRGAYRVWISGSLGSGVDPVQG